MSSPTTVPESKETPMERIFYKVTGRKMTSREKAILQLHGKTRPSLRGGSHGAAKKGQSRN